MHVPFRIFLHNLLLMVVLPVLLKYHLLQVRPELLVNRMGHVLERAVREFAGWHAEQDAGRALYDLHIAHREHVVEGDGSEGEEVVFFWA